MNEHSSNAQFSEKLYSGERELILDLLRQSLHTFQARSGMIAVREKGVNRLKVLAHIGLSRSLNKEEYLKTAHSISNYVMETGREAVIDERHPPPLNLNYVRSRDRCSACIPLVYPDGEIRGVITLNKKNGAFPRDQFPFIRLVSREIGVILKEMELKKERDQTISTLNSISRIFQGLTCLSTLEDAFSSILEAALLALGGGRGMFVQTSPPPLRIWAQSEWEIPEFTQEEKEQVREVLDSIRIIDSPREGVPSQWPLSLCLPERTNPHHLLVWPLAWPTHEERRALLILLPFNIPDPLSRRVLEIIENLSMTILENISLFDENQKLAVRQERVQIARELHDGLNQSLVAVRMRLEHLKHLTDQQESSASEISNISGKIYQTLTHCIEESRGILKRLREDQPGDIPLLLLVKNRLKELLPTKNMRYSFHCSVCEEKLSPGLKYTLYYLLREAVSNTAKHSHADKLSIKLCRMYDRVYLGVRDNGIGFELEEAMTRHGCLGLKGMEERVAAQKGRFRIRSSKGRGTSLIVRFKINE